MNFFELFGLPVEFSIQQEELQKRYFDLQANYHPDKADSQLTSQQFLNKSIDINQGYKILKDDYSRAVHLLQLKGIDLNAEEQKEYHLPPKRLEQIWQAREQVELFTAKEELQNIFNSAINERAEIFEHIKVSFVEKKYNEAAILVVELKYINNLIQSIKDKLAKCS